MNVKRWLSVGLCCLPGMALVAVLGIGAIAGGATFDSTLQGPIGLGLIGLAVLACPLSMGLMMLRNRDMAHSGEPANIADCCLPGDQALRNETDRVAELRTRREALEQQVAELQNQ